MKQVEISYDPEQARFTVNVPTERGDTAVVYVDYCAVRDTYSIDFSALLLRQSPQALTAAIQLALRAVQDHTRLWASQEPTQ